MDVSLGLISKLVKCKSVQRAMAPIASQVSLLIILTEQNAAVDDEGLPSQVETSSQDSRSVSLCASNMATSIEHFIALGERETNTSTDEVFQEQMRSACETLELAKTDLFVWSQRYQSDPTVTSGTRRSLCQAAKDVLQAVLKVLLVLDDREIRQMVAMVTQTEVAVAAVGRVKESNQLLPSFKQLTESVLKLKQKLDGRVQDMCSRASCTQLLVAVGVLRKSVPSLSMAVQTALKYRSNVGAQTSKESVVQEMLSCLCKIRVLLQSGAQEAVDDPTNSFVAVVDKVLDHLGEEQRSPLDQDIESVVVSLVRHSMAVAHHHWGSYRELIVTSCHRILQGKFRLLELDSAMRDNPQHHNIRLEYDNTCETILDEVCDLEKHVNMTLLQLIVETFMEVTQPLDNLVKAALGYKDDPLPFLEVHSKMVDHFLQHSESVCHISQLVAASSTDLSRVQEIHACVQCLESLTPDLLPALTSVAGRPLDSGQARQLRGLVKRWHLEMAAVVAAIDNMADPHVFLDMTETRLERECDLGVTPHSRDDVSPHKLRASTGRSLLLSQRALQVGERILDCHADPIYRDGLRVFLNKLSEAIVLARAAANDFLSSRESTKLLDTLQRRLQLLRSAVGELRAGLDVRSHPPILSHARNIGRQRTSQFNSGDVLKRRNNTDALLQQGRQQRKQQQHQQQHQQQQQRRRPHKPLVKPDEPTSPTTTTAPVVSLPTGATPAVTSDGPSDSKKLADRSVGGDSEQRPSRSSGVGNVQSWPAEFADDGKNGLGGAVEDFDADLSPSSEIQMLVRRLVTACRAGDRLSTDELTSQVLGWTNHVIEAGHALTTHCGRIPKSSELTQLVKEIDRQAPEVIQKAKFVVSGDLTALTDLLTDAAAWAKKLERARIIVDVAADRWLMLTGVLCQAIHTHDGIQLKVMVSSITRAQQEMCQILLKTRFLSGKFVERGQEILEFLSDCHAEIENMAVTIATTVDVATISATRTPSDRWQLVQVSRDWAVAMTCVVADLDLISDTMEALGRETFQRLRDKAAMKESRLADTLQAETNSLLELVDCVVCGDDALRTGSEKLVSELNAALDDVTAVARQPVMLTDVPQYPLFCRLRIGLARSRWMEKAVEVRDMVRDKSREFGAPLRQLMEAMRELTQDSDETSRDREQTERDRLCRLFLATSRQVKQKSLAVVQTCSDLPRRAVIRATLDQLDKLTTDILAAMKGRDLTESEVHHLSDQWGSRLRKLMVQLRKTEEIRPGLVNEIEKLAKGSAMCDPSRPSLLQATTAATTATTTAAPRPFLHHHLTPAATATTTLQPPLAAAQPQPQPQPDRSGGSGHSSEYLHSQTDSFSTPAGKAVRIVLKDAQFLDFRLHKWLETDREGDEDEEVTPRGSKVVQAALEVARLCSNMTLFTKGGGCFQRSEEVIGAAVAVTQHVGLLSDFGRTLQRLTPDPRLASNAEICGSQMGNFSSQLNIIATALQNSAQSVEGDRMLARNACNLLHSVRQLFLTAEAVAIKGVQEATSMDEMTQEVTSLMSRCRDNHQRYLRQERETSPVDDLGLRRVELHNPPLMAAMLDLP
ncbi:uncharacterized protein LOC101852205 [Aplysia californica]|uniref:Uncharacterized protein LOC101852205 n=1 Tax=Aplysia californica TaxID=6500 RepID=A0ABM1A7A4_APLCA|nr:uncharacterized protein LOC101852205 [Aplysia californica]